MRPDHEALTPSRRTAALLLWVVAGLAIGQPAGAWGDEGHEVIGLIAEHYLTSTVRARVEALLATDDSGLTSRDIAHEATWADQYRDSDRGSSRQRYYGTRNWHFVDLELDGVDPQRACREDCIITKIVQFRSELRNARTGPAERLLALQFLLHLVGDLHQPLHAADDHDQGGNRKIVSVPGIGIETLHQAWDTEFVRRLGADDTDIAGRLIARITDEQRRQWSRGTPLEWALETYAVAKRHAYGLLPLSESYVADATVITEEQLSKAGVRLASVLNQALE